MGGYLLLVFLFICIEQLFFFFLLSRLTHIILFALKMKLISISLLLVSSINAVVIWPYNNHTDITRTRASPPSSSVESPSSSVILDGKDTDDFEVIDNEKPQEYDNSKQLEEEPPRRPEIILDRPSTGLRRGRRGSRRPRRISPNRNPPVMESQLAERALYPQEYLDDDFVEGYTVIRPEPNYDIAIRLNELPENTTKAVLKAFVYPGEFYQSQASKPNSILAKENMNEYLDKLNGQSGRHRMTEIHVAGTYAGSIIPNPLTRPSSTADILSDSQENDDPYAYSKVLPNQLDISPFLNFLKEGTEIRLSLDSYRMFKQVKYYDHDLLVKLVTWEVDSDPGEE